MGDLILEVKQERREMKGMLGRTVLIPGELHCVEAGLEAGRKFAKLRAMNRGKNLGSAHIPIALQFLATLPDTIDFKESKDRMGSLKLFWD